jgi:hypothetical protein
MQVAPHQLVLHLGAKLAHPRLIQRLAVVGEVAGMPRQVGAFVVRFGARKVSRHKAADLTTAIYAPSICDSVQEAA